MGFFTFDHDTGKTTSDCPNKDIPDEMFQHLIDYRFLKMGFLKSQIDKQDPVYLHAMLVIDGEYGRIAQREMKEKKHGNK